MKDERKQRRVSLVIRAKIDNKWRRLPVIYGRTGRVIPGRVTWGNKELQFDNAAYEIRYYMTGKVCYLAAGNNASLAEEKRRTLQIQLSARAIAQTAGLAIVEPCGRKSIKTSAEEHLTNKATLVCDAQFRKERYGIHVFMEVINKHFVDELTKTDILRYVERLKNYPVYWLARKTPSKRIGALRERRRIPSQQRCLSARTVFQYFMIVRAWLLSCGVDRSIFPPPPKYEEIEVTAYTPEEIKTFFSLATGNLRMAVSLMLKCGMRRNEAAHACFDDIDYSSKTILIRGKAEYNFNTKTRKQRYVPIPDDLFAELIAWKEAHPKQRLIIQTAKGKPDCRIIRELKRFAYLNGMRCGHCAHCRSGNPNCEAWQLHKFRRTYLTRVCRKTDLRTAQEYAGHTRLSSTQRYLKPASAAEGQKRVSSIDFTENDYD